MQFLQQLNALLLRIAGWGVIVTMGIIAVVIPYEVAERYFLGNMPAWSGELATFSLVWASMLGAAIGLKKGYQVGMTFFLEKLSGRLALIIRVTGQLVMLGFLALMVYYGSEQTLLNLHQVSPALEIKMAVPYAALPIGFCLMLLVTLEELFTMFGTGAQGRS